MQIRDFDSIRVGSGFPGALDIDRIDGHENYGVYATAFTYRNENETGYVQVRKHNKDKLVALFTFRLDCPLPEFWQDSTVIWDSRDLTNQ